MNPATTEIVLTICWLIRELVPLFRRKRKGYGGPFWSIPPDELDTQRDSPQAKRRKS